MTNYLLAHAGHAQPLAHGLHPQPVGHALHASPFAHALHASPLAATGPLLIAGLVGVVIAVGLLLWGISIYNRLVSARERGKNAFAQIDVQLERRHDLIPNLVETAKGYMAHEKDTLEAVLKARASATQARIQVNGNPSNAAAMQQLGQAEGQLSGALGRLMAVAEAYPDLKANQNMMQLSEELTSTENKVAFARQAYNDAALRYNEYKQQVPPVLIAGPLGFEHAAYLEIEEGKKAAPQVSFGSGAAAAVAG